MNPGPLGATADEDRPTPSRTVHLPAPDAATGTRTVWNGCGEILGTGMATLYGRTGVSPVELRRSAAAALAMADLLESDGWREPAECFCCTCPLVGRTRGWDAHCRQHGGHGLRPCTLHGRPGRGCDCGCGEVEVPEPRVLESATAGA